jgi:7,8-dihydropterin-6-yl-methyl-4-(beta-D-ribofuranosyl)aminobenzene 5'-phosphate synthase
MDNVELTVVYDNYRAREGLRTAHGFACVARTRNGIVLFDTGGSGQILLENARKLGIEPAGIDAVVLSHMHWDHIGGLDFVLAANPRVTVFLPSAFSANFIKDIRARAGAVVETMQTRQVTGQVHTTDAMESPLVEQGLYVETAEGIVVVTGCAHPGVVELARAAQNASGRQVHAVLGGFHMTRMDEAGIDKAVSGLRDLGVSQVGPCHCSGDAARKAMEAAFGSGYLDIGAGAELSFRRAAGG